MPREVERKYLVTGDGWREAARQGIEMSKGYLGGDRCPIRVRLEGELANINIKSRGIGPFRDEDESVFPVSNAREILEGPCPGSVTRKTRHLVEYGGHTWEVDEFHGDNEALVVAEAQLCSTGDRPARPDWLGSEVTMEERYYNQQLSRHPYRDW